MNIYSLFMEDAYNEAYTEMVKYYEEKSHRKLQFDYRQVLAAKDYPDLLIDEGDRLLCVYELKGVQITSPGGAFTYISGINIIRDTPMDKLGDKIKDPDKLKEITDQMKRDNAEVQKNIAKKGNTDHQSYGQRLIAVKDLVTGDQWTAEKNPGLELEVKGLWNSTNPNPKIFKIKLGEIESEENKSFKSTKNFTNIDDGNKYDGNRLGQHERIHKYFRGVEKDNMNELNPTYIDKTVADKLTYSKNGTVDDVTIQKEINTIKPNAFSRKQIKTIKFESNSRLRKIGAHAFEYCVLLTLIELPNLVTVIGNGAFTSCKSLTSITIPASVNIIGKNAFANCKSLKDVKILGKPKIDNSAFKGCSNLSEESKKKIQSLQPSIMFESYVETYDEFDFEEDFYESIYEAVAKEDIYKINYYLRDHLQNPYVAPVLQKRKNRDAILDFAAKFMDDHNKELSTSGPVYGFTFAKKETDFLYGLFGLSDKHVLAIYDEMINETYYGKISKNLDGLVRTSPHKILITAILAEAKKNGYTDVAEACSYIFGWCEYPILLKKSFTIGVKPEVMDYTIEHLPGKFKIVREKLNTLQKLLKYDTDMAIALYEKSMEGDYADNQYIDFIYRLRNQMKSTLVNLANVYYGNVKANNTQHQSVSEFDDGQKADQDGINTNIAQCVDNTVNKFASTELNSSMIKIVAENSQIDKGNLSGYLAQIFNTKNNKVAKFIENIITLYFNKNPASTSLDSNEFLNFGLSLYRSIGTSKDPLMNEIKQILNMWMNDIINIRASYGREATITNYTRGIFNYFIMMIKYYN